MKAMSGNDWSLRIVHEGTAGLTLERQGRRIRFDPVDELSSDDIVVLTGADPFAPERAVGFHTVLRANGAGEVDAEIDGVRFEGLPYIPPDREPVVRRMGGAVRRPGEAARRWLARRRPDVSTIWRLTFPNGDALVHLGLSMHDDTDVGWAADVVTRFGQPRWLVVGVPFGQDEAVKRRVPAMGAKHVMVTDLEGDLRRTAGRSSAFVTPLSDALEAAGVPAMVFVPASSVRFE
jgi:hypothetical protein